ncbi:MAG: dihydroneopterin aldolase [Glaciimonas sp.]|nr:dihydroneopterin aldolase [Glaciimonas sp.]
MPSALIHPALSDCRRLFLRNYEVMINIGVYDSEKKGAQRVLINIDLYVPLSLTTPKHDQENEVLDYNLMRNTIKQRMDEGHVHLQETLCDDIAQRLLSHPAVRAVRVSTEKTDAYPDCDSVGVEVFQIKPSA